MSKWGLFQGCKADSVFKIQCNSPGEQGKVKKENHMTISTEAESTFDKIQYLFMTEILRKLRLEWNFLNFIKNIYKNKTPHSQQHI